MSETGSCGQRDWDWDWDIRSSSSSESLHYYQFLSCILPSIVIADRRHPSSSARRKDRSTPRKQRNGYGGLCFASCVKDGETAVCEQEEFTIFSMAIIAFTCD